MTALVPLASAFASQGSFSWWQSLGGLVAVLALLVVFLKLLGRVNRRMSGEEAGLEKVWPLGPRREIQVLRLGDEVHYIYRHDGAMVLLKRQPHAEWLRDQTTGQDDEPPQGWERFLPGSFGLEALKPRKRVPRAG